MGDSMDIQKSGRLSTAAFVGTMKRLRYKGDAKTIFRALDVDVTGYIGIRELKILNTFHPHLTAELVEAATPAPSAAKGSNRQHQPKTKSSSNSNLHAPQLHDDVAQSGRGSRSDNMQLLQLQDGELQGYPYKGFKGCPRVADRSEASTISTDASRSRYNAAAARSLAQKKQAQQKEADAAAKASLLESQARAAQIAEI